MNTMVDLAKSMLVESAQSIIVESEKANFRPFGKEEWMGYGGAETNAAIPTPMVHDHDDNNRILISGHPDDPNAVHIEVHSMGNAPDYDFYDLKSSSIQAHKDTWMHKAALAKNALTLHGNDHEAAHNALLAHGFSRDV